MKMSNSQVIKAEHIARPQNRSRKTLLLVLIAFILPVILAKLALEQQWFTKGVTNKGTLITNGMTLQKMGFSNNDFTDKWLILYLLPSDCLPQCQQTLHSINNTYVALGKEIDRVQAVALTYRNFTTEQRQQIPTEHWSFQLMPTATKQLFNRSQVLIVDTLGNVILSYQAPNDSKSLPIFGKAILADLKKLLKYSKIG
jgi:peroxiredoxin